MPMLPSARPLVGIGLEKRPESDEIISTERTAGDRSLPQTQPNDENKTIESVHCLMTDPHSKLTLVIPCAKKTAPIVATALLEHWIAIYGIPNIIMTDKGPQFMSKLFAALCVSEENQAGHNMRVPPGNKRTRGNAQQDTGRTFAILYG